MYFQHLNVQNVLTTPKKLILMNTENMALILLLLFLVVISMALCF